MIKEIRHKGETSFMLLTSALTLAGVSIISKAYWNTFRAELKTIEIDAPQKMQFERALKVLHLTDIHVEKLSISPEKVVELVDGETFDFIALTGDYLDRIKSIDRFLSFLETLVHIPTRHGLFAVWGNHDWVIADHLPLLKRKMEQLGVQVLANEAVSVTHEGKAIHIIGIDDHHSGHSDVRQAFATVPEHGYRMILTHDPLIVKQKMPAFDYLICGHLHSGQISTPCRSILSNGASVPFANICQVCNPITRVKCISAVVWGRRAPICVWAVGLRSPFIRLRAQMDPSSCKTKIDRQL